MSVRDQELVVVHVLVIGALGMGFMGSFCFAGFDIVGRLPWYFLSGMVDGGCESGWSRSRELFVNLGMQKLHILKIRSHQKSNHENTKC